MIQLPRTAELFKALFSLLVKYLSAFTMCPITNQSKGLQTEKPHCSMILQFSIWQWRTMCAQTHSVYQGGQNFREGKKYSCELSSKSDLWFSKCFGTHLPFYTHVNPLKTNTRAELKYKFWDDWVYISMWLLPKLGSWSGKWEILFPSIQKT